MWTILLYIVTAINLLLYLYIIVVTVGKWKVSKAHRRFSWLLIFILAWLSSVYVMVGFNQANIYIFLVHFNFSVAPLVAAMLVLFCLHFPRENLNVTPLKEITIISPLLLLSILSYTKIFVVVHSFQNYSNSRCYFIYLFVLIVYFIFAAGYILIKRYHSLNGVYRLQLRYIIVGYLLAIIIELFIESVYSNIVGPLPLVLDRFVINVSLLFSAFSAFAMLRYRFMDVRVIIRKGVVYSISLLIALSLYTYIALILKETIEESWNVHATWTAVILIALVALGFPPLKNIVEKAINTLFKGQKSIDLAVKEVQEKIVEKTDLQTLVDLICLEVKKYLNIDVVELYIINHKEQLYSVEDAGEQKEIEKKNDLIRYFEKYSNVLVRDEIPHLLEEHSGKFEHEMLQKTEKEIRKRKASLAMPFKTEDEVFGLLLIGERNGSRAYTVQDVQFLEKVREQTEFIIANALLYKETMANLQERAKSMQPNA
jgi:hypothetical protein